jgi:hypothetical protein
MFHGVEEVDLALGWIAFIATAPGTQGRGLRARILMDGKLHSTARTPEAVG